MPPLPPVANVVKLRLHFDIGTDVGAICRIYLRWTGTTPTNADLATAAASAYTSAVTNLIPLMHVDNDLTAIDIEDLTSPSAAFGSHVALTAGTRSGTPLTAATATLINLIIGRRYRGGKPRIYFPFGTSGDMASPSAFASGYLSSAAVGIQQWITDLLAISVGGWSMTGLVNVSYYNGFTAVQNPLTGRWRNAPKVRTGTIPVDAITNFSVNPKPGSQRRRNLHS